MRLANANELNQAPELSVSEISETKRWQLGMGFSTGLLKANVTHFSENKQLFEGDGCRDGGRGGELRQLRIGGGCLGCGWEGGVQLMEVLATSPDLTETTGLLTA